LENIYLKLNELAEIISIEIKEKSSGLKSGIKIASIIIGNDPASISYLRGMQKKALKLGMHVEIFELPENTGEHEFLEKIRILNNDNTFSGIIVQVPLPKKIDPFLLAETIDFRKDLDGINPLNQGRLFSGKPFMIPATAWAVDLTLKYIEKKYDFKLQGKNAVIIGRSLTVGKPVFHLLLQRNITPTVVHTKTVSVQEITSKADILVACCGMPEMVKDTWIRENAVIIDVGIHSIECDDKTERLCGDVKSDSVLKKASIVTAVPGGIGSLTSTLVFANALKGYFKISFKEEINFNFGAL
jgi:methylenetetrahydrofolate dehydrogenase (NADP+) / methenyltetrahydrofolate cyclohydrolase